MVNFFIISIVNSSCNTDLHVRYKKKLWLTAKKLPLMDWSGNTSDLDPIAKFLECDGEQGDKEGYTIHPEAENCHPGGVD